jgi:rhodanese-related sulfurtransferase
MDVVGQGGGADIVGLSVARVDVPRMGIRGPAARPVVPALPASLAALLLAHRIELEIDVCDLFDAQLRGDAPPLIDARVTRAFRTGHIPEAIHMPPDSVSRGAVLALPPAPFIVVYGSDALRLDAVRTAHAIADMGFAVKILSGGYAAWAAQGFPVEQAVRSEGRIAAL